VKTEETCRTSKLPMPGCASKPPSSAEGILAGTVARGAINSLVRRIILPAPSDVNHRFGLTTGIELLLAGPIFSATICE